ncbi:class I SAM-dependent methyltransferase [Achromobacter sp. DH1f]|uniref:class I SAM-dependent methyltransferase n=1 Tax=Achromobacter sp. DH1f TaxID=1397275 RepID=UPI00046978B1|nr:methyltransferase domain-containing protein [Achromobacter sp. DH1f]
MTTHASRYSDYLHFFAAWLGNPLKVAAIAPSGAALAELITRDVRPGSGPVLELGPGTGAFTRALLARGVDEASLVLVEPDARFAQLLQRRYPRASIHQIDAARLGRAGLAAGAAEAVVSGLPLLAMPPRQVMAILASAFGQLAPQGCFYQFTYGVRCPVPRVILDRLGLKATRMGRTLFNLPPATVYRFSRRPPARGSAVQPRPSHPHRH